MALWYECGNGLVSTRMARSWMHSDVYLCCPGPSLQQVDYRDLQVTGAITCALNTAYPHIRPNIWIGMDVPESFDSRLWWEPFIKIARGGYHNKRSQGYYVKDFFNVFFADCTEPESRDELFNLRQHDVRFVWHKHTLGTALHILVWLGARKIHLLGCDLGGDRDYCHDLVLSEELRKSNRQLYRQQVGYLKWFCKAGKRYDVQLISCTPDSPINKFANYLPVHEAIAETAKKNPLPLKPKHVLATSDFEKKVNETTGPTNAAEPIPSIEKVADGKDDK